MTRDNMINQGRLSAPVMGMVFVLLAIAVWGCYFSLAIIVLRKTSVVEFLMYRWGFGAAALLLLNLRLRRSLNVSRGDWVVVGSAVLVGIVLHQLLQVSGLRFTTSTNTGWILTVTPPATGILGWAFLKERMHARQIIGLAVAMAGVLLFVTNGHLGEITIGAHRGDFLVLGSVFTWSIFTILTKSRLHRYDALGLSIVYMILGFGTFLILKLIESGVRVPSLSPTEWLIVVWIGVFPSGLAYYWWNAGLQRLTAVNTSMFLFIEAVIASVFGAIVLGEGFSTAMALFAVVIVAGVSIAQGTVRLRRNQAGDGGN